VSLEFYSVKTVAIKMKWPFDRNSEVYFVNTWDSALE
jgi:hypothetical protein